MGREGMQHVELSDETPDETDADATDAGTTTEPAAAHRRARRRRRSLAFAGIVLVGLIGTQVVLDARERDHLAHLASIPGVLAPMDESIGVLWSSSDFVTLSSLYGTAFGDVTIGAYIDDSNERTVRAVHTRTGEVVWSTVLTPADPSAPARGWGSSPSCTLDAGATTPQVVCLVTDSALLGNADAPPTPVAATFARLVVLDPTTGAVLAQHDEPVSSAASVGVLDGVAIVASRTESGHLAVVGEDPLTGAERWRFESPAPLTPALPTAWSLEASGLTVDVSAGRVAVTASGGEVWVLSGTGDLVDATPAGDRTGVEHPRTGLVAVVDYDMSTPSGRSMRVVGREGTSGAAYSQPPATFVADDGTLPNLLFTMGDAFDAWDLTTGNLLWSSGLPAGSDAVLLDGRIYARSLGGHLVALDAATGATLWEVLLARADDSSVFTDGRSIVAIEPSSASSQRIVAFDPADGHRQWDAALPDSVSRVWQVGRRLVGQPYAGGSMSVLG